MAKDGGSSSKRPRQHVRLLPGEDPESRYAEDADHWLGVYTELLQTKAELLLALNERLGRTESDVARQEIVETDLRVLETEVKRFQERIDFWKARRRELSDPD